jgi:hypothetical protein
MKFSTPVCPVYLSSKREEKKSRGIVVIRSVGTCIALESRIFFLLSHPLYWLRSRQLPYVHRTHLEALPLVVSFVVAFLATALAQSLSFSLTYSSGLGCRSSRSNATNMSTSTTSSRNALKARRCGGGGAPSSSSPLMPPARTFVQSAPAIASASKDGLPMLAARRRCSPSFLVVLAGVTWHVSFSSPHMSSRAVL